MNQLLGHHRPSFLLALPLLATLACAGSDEPGGPPGPAADLAGTWTYFDTIANESQVYTCIDQGSLEFVQAEAALTGTSQQVGYCAVPGDSSVGNSGTASIEGSATLESVQFNFAGCSYTGDLHHNPVDSIAGTVACHGQVAGRLLTLTGTWFAVRGTDWAFPTVAGHLTAPSGDTVAVPGDTIEITIEGTDDRKVQWVGFRLGIPVTIQDSARVDAAAGSRTFRVRIDAGNVGRQPLERFSRDALGRPAVDTVSFRVVNAVRRPVHTVPIGAVASDMAFDARRNLLYLLVPERAEVAVLDLATFAFRTPLALPFAAAGAGSMRFDILPGGDTLVLAPTTPGLVFVDLRTGASSTRPVSGVNYLTSPVITAANNKVFALGQTTNAGYIIYSLWEYDVATGSARRRTDVGQGGNLGATPELARSGDYTRLLLLDINTGCAGVYTSSTDQFTPCATIGFTDPSVPTASTSGDRWLLRHLLADAVPGILATVRPLEPGAGTISPDAQVAYYPWSHGAGIVRIPDGASLGHVRVQERVSRLTILPDGRRLIAWTDPGTGTTLNTDRVTIVDLQP